MTPEELELLTPEERAGLELEDDTTIDADDPDENQDDDDQDDSDEGEDQDSDEDQDDDDGQGQGEDGDGDDGDDQGADDQADDSQPGRDDGADPDDQGDDGQDEANPDRPVVPQFTLQAPEDVENRLAGLDTREDELNEQFDDGDISAADFRKAMREINQQRDDIKWDVRKYDQAKERHAETVAAAEDAWLQNWYKETNEFAKAHPEIARNKTVMQVFDNLVREVNTEENINKFSHQTRLEMAYKRWAEDLGIDTQAPAGKGKGKAKQAEGKKQTPPKKHDLPPSLGKVPASEVNETDDGKYGLLNRLFNSSKPTDVAKAEDMLSRMSEAEQDRYLRSN